VQLEYVWMWLWIHGNGGLDQLRTSDDFEMECRNFSNQRFVGFCADWFPAVCDVTTAISKLTHVSLSTIISDPLQWPTRMRHICGTSETVSDYRLIGMISMRVCIAKHIHLWRLLAMWYVYTLRSWVTSVCTTPRDIALCVFNQNIIPTSCGYKTSWPATTPVI
jgi:hypothetical protein